MAWIVVVRRFETETPTWASLLRKADIGEELVQTARTGGYHSHGGSPACLMCNGSHPKYNG